MVFEQLVDLYLLDVEFLHIVTLIREIGKAIAVANEFLHKKYIVIAENAAFSTNMTKSKPAKAYRDNINRVDVQLVQVVVFISFGPI